MNSARGSAHIGPIIIFFPLYFFPFEFFFQLAPLFSSSTFLLIFPSFYVSLFIIFPPNNISRYFPSSPKREGSSKEHLEAEALIVYKFTEFNFFLSSHKNGCVWRKIERNMRGICYDTLSIRPTRFVSLIGWQKVLVGFCLCSVY